MRSVRLATALLSGTLMAACGTPAHATAPAAAAAQPGRALSVSTDNIIARDQARLRAEPGAWAAVDELAGAYLQKVREVGDPSYYPKVEALLTRALQHDPSDIEATTLMGTLALARHQFSQALGFGQKAHALNPFGSRPLGIISDAQTQLGDYQAAVAALQQMVDLRPDLSSYSRVSYLRELYGDLPGAVDAMRRAVEAGGPVPENVAYARVLLGTLYFNRGQLREAEAEYQGALIHDPGYVQALAGVASVRAAQRHYPQAISLYQRAIDIYPIPQYVIALGDVYAAAGNPRRAGETYDLAAAEQALFQANGVDLDTELALFNADHGRNLPQALAAANRAMRDRPNVVTADALAWTLYATGDFQGALAASRKAHLLGTHDALFFFHTGMIEAKLGMTAAARTDLRTALDLNPTFSVLQVPHARQTLAALGGQP